MPLMTVLMEMLCAFSLNAEFLTVCLFFYPSREQRRRRKVVDEAALRGTRNARMLLEKWRARQHHRQKAWLTRNAAS